MEKCGHFPHIENPQKFNRILHDFLTDANSRPLEITQSQRWWWSLNCNIQDNHGKYFNYTYGHKQILLVWLLFSPQIPRKVYSDVSIPPASECKRLEAMNSSPRMCKIEDFLNSFLSGRWSAHILITHSCNVQQLWCINIITTISFPTTSVVEVGTYTYRTACELEL